MIYFIATCGFIKIGFSENPKARFNKLAPDTPHQASLIGAVAGNKDREKQIQKMFSAFAYRGEWFRDVNEIRRFLHQNSASLDCNDKTQNHDIFVAYIKAKRGRAFAVANAIGVAPSAISQWDRVPAERVPDVSRATGIPREQLRPDLYEAAA